MSRIVYRGLDPQKVIHPEDAAVISKLKKIPGFEKLFDHTFAYINSALAGIELLGDGYDITDETYPEAFAEFRESCKILGLDPVPRLASQWEYAISSYSIGRNDNYMVALSSGAFDLLNPEELNFMYGHEIGHIICGHLPYHQMVELIYTPIFDDPIGIASIIRMPLLDWYRKSHFSADRMGLLCCQDINVALRTMQKMSGLPKKYYETVPPEAILSQCADFERDSQGTFNGLIESMYRKAASYPWMVLRAKVLYEWYLSDDYKALMEKYSK